MNRATGVGALVVAAVLALFAHPPPVAGCPRPYESAERMVARAPIIVEVEVLSVGDAPAPGPPWSDRGLAGEQESARARVLVARVVRGHLPFREFTLLGGPYDSCALFPTYLRFAAGERFFLFLENAVPETTRTIRIFRAPRLFRGTEADLERLLARVHAAWARRIQILREIAPEDTAAAEKLAARFRATGSFGDVPLGDLPYAARFALSEFLCDPSRPLPRPAAPLKRPTPEGEPIDMEPAGDEETYVAGEHAAEIPADLARALAAGPRREAHDLARRFLVRYLREELLVGEELAERFAAAVPDGELRIPPEHLRLEENTADDLVSVRALVLLANVEDDCLVRGGNPRAPVPEILVPWLTRHGGETAVSWTTVRFLMRLRHPAAIPAVARTMRESSAGCQLDDYLRWFLDLGDLEEAAAVVERAEQLAAVEREEPGTRRLGDWRRDLLEAARTAGERAAPLLPRLEALPAPR